MNRHASKKDANHNELRDLFVQMGCSVVETHCAGIAGFPDFVIGCIGVSHLVEAKSLASRYGRSGFNENQSAFNRDWRGEPVASVATPDEVIDLVQKWRAKKC